MEPIRINLASVDYFDKRMIFAVMAVMVIISLLLFSLNIRRMNRLAHEAEGHRVGIERQKKDQDKKKKTAQLQKMAVGEKEIGATLRHTVFVNRLLAKDIFPWDRILDAFEKKMPEGIFPERLSADETFGRVILTGYADSMDSVQSYLRQREEADLFQKIVLIRISAEQEPPAKGGKPPVRFEIESTLQPERLFPEKEFGLLWKVMIPEPKSDEEDRGSKAGKK
ncbi:hypothetical protein DENIS_0768 [Desulfonema ishimotonii]|uniref:Uncharacterized protein n=1 Tax=Desulfonema ishimotonii TaxID=45657 RepID=A0A401FS84_9BACT|nr:PilN domain-containing protein [Desulfonema ishimotonii]GBC59827.1 hypothetical protein DENIS_0768 [Desulfonema ishimotonii]